MGDSLDDTISLWLHQVLAATRCPTAKRKRQPSRYPSPPDSATNMSSAVDGDVGEGDPERPVFETPKKRKTTHDVTNDATPRAASHSSASLLSRSDSSLPLGASHSQSGRLSPTKQLSRLTLDPAGLQLCSLDLDDPRLPPDAAGLVERLQEVWGGVAIVESRLKHAIDELKMVSRQYNKFQTTVYTQDDPAATTDVIENPVLGLAATEGEKALHLLRSAVHIVDKAQECHRTNQDESGWNHLVHTPLIDAAFHRHSAGPSSLTPCMNANIIPTYRMASSPSSRINYVFTLNPIQQERFLSPQPRTKAIQAFQSIMPELSINQTDDSPVLDQPISISIETKRYGGQERKAEMQLGIWLAAQWRLYAQRVSPEGLRALQFLPGVVVQGHEWKLVLATYDENGKTRLWTYQQFGTTDTVLGAFQVVAGLKELIRWSEGSFSKWYDEYMLQMTAQTKLIPKTTFESREAGLGRVECDTPRISGPITSFEVAKYASEAFMFQRTPARVHPKPNPPTDIDEWNMKIASKPGWQDERNRNYHRFLNHYPEKPKHDDVDDSHTKLVTFCGNFGTPRAITPELAPAWMQHLNLMDIPLLKSVHAIVDKKITDPVRAEKLKAWFPVWCKRPLFSDDYLPTLNRPNVHVIDTNGNGVDSLTDTGVVAAGQEYPVDVIIMATGFQSPWGSPDTKVNMKITGVQGLNMRQKWDTGMTTLHGVVSRDFPNLFWPGPSQSSISPANMFVLEGLAKHIAAIITKSSQTGAALNQKPRVQPTATAEDSWGNRVASMMSNFASAVGCTPSLSNGEGDLEKLKDSLTPEKKATMAKLGMWGRGVDDYLAVLQAWRNEGSWEGLEQV